MVEKKLVLKSTDLMIGYPSGKKMIKAVAGPLNLELYAGQLICLLGPNGCGKSTLLKTISGLQPALAGHIELDGEDLKYIKATGIARKVSLVLTEKIRSAHLDVYTVIALGRYPYSGWLGHLSDRDQQAIDFAVKATFTSAFLNRKMDSLSDGECQKVMLARAIAQDTPVIILDEPTAHLDLPSRIQLMRLLHQLAKNTHKAILISTHELDLALQAADQIWLMDNDGGFASGLPEELVLNGSFQQAFAKEGIAFDVMAGTFQLHQEGKVSIGIVGEGPAFLWTKRALIRTGYQVTDATEERYISLFTENGGTSWTLHQKDSLTSYPTLSGLLRALHPKG